MSIDQEFGATGENLQGNQTSLGSCKRCENLGESLNKGAGSQTQDVKREIEM